MKSFLRLISVIICAATLLSCAMFISADAATFDKNAYPSSGDGASTQIPLGSKYGVRLGINGEFSAVSVRLSTYLNGDTISTVSVYKWNNDYETTVKSDPVASKQFNPVKDNQKHKVEFDKQPAGEYLIEVSNDNSALCVWKWDKNEFGHGFVYVDGVEGIGDINLTVSFTENVAEPFKEIKPSEEMNSSGTAPEEFKPDENSAVIVRAAQPTTWAATDELGRTLPTYEETGAKKDGKTVALFYWSWHVSQDSGEPLNIQGVMDEHPEIQNDFKSPIWPKTRTVHFWNESIYGYYKTNDRWVLRKHAELLADAGVDVIFFDNTNGTFTFRDSYVHIFETFQQALDDGVKVPKISFLLPFGDKDSANTQMRALYQDIFQKGKYQQLWFYFEDKPMIMCNKSFVNASDDLGKQIRKFFTFRTPQPGYRVGNKIYDSWGWLSVYPQTMYMKKKEAGVEQMTVGVAINHNYKTHELSAMNGENIIGRTYTSKGIDTRENAVKYGANFAEQFEYAISCDPKVIFITGWNEWIAGRYEEWCGVKNAFPDEFNDEFSRDIEPSKGRLRDNYYYQMVSYIRKFKGCDEIPVYSDKDTIDLNGAASQWDSVKASYIAYQNNVGDRDAKGYGSKYYTDNSGRNDFTDAKVASDNEYLYFMAQCAGDITPYTDKNWMNLYIDTDDNNQGWETFDFVIGKKPADNNKAYLQKFTGTGYETADVSTVDYSVNGKQIVIKVKKADLNITDKDYKVCFKWTDNVQDEDGSGEFKGEILDFYRTGDVAPGGRFKYVYTFKDDGNDPAPVTTEEMNTTDTPVDTAAETPAESTTEESTQSSGNNALPIILGVIGAVAVAAVVAVIILKSKKK